MLRLTKITFSAACVFWLYFQKVFTVEYLFHYSWKLFLRQLPFESQQFFGDIVLTVIGVGICLMAYGLIERSRATHSQKFFCFVVMVSPLAFALSDIFDDKSCFKPWLNPDKLWWHALINLPLWLLIIGLTRKKYRAFDVFEQVLIVLIFVAYHFIKKY